MTLLSKNTKYLMELAGLNPTSLARALSARYGSRAPKQSTIHRIATGEIADPHTDTVRAIATYFDRTDHELRSVDLAGEDKRRKAGAFHQLVGSSRGGSPPYTADGARPAGDALTAFVPVISWARASLWPRGRDRLPEDTQIIQTTGGLGPHAFALVATGDAMQPTIPDGALLIVDPDRMHKHGSIVIAQRPEDRQPLLRRWWLDGATPYLRAENPAFPILAVPERTRIIGVVVRHQVDHG